VSGKELQSLPGPETMDGVHYDASLKRIYMTGGRWYGTPEASSGWVYVYQQKDPDHYDLLSKIKTRFWPPRSWYPNSIVYTSRLRQSVSKRPPYWFTSRCHDSSFAVLSITSIDGMIPAPAKSIDAFSCSPAISVIVMFGWSRGHRGVRDSIFGAGAIGLRPIHSHKELKLDE
jgi:hypothetical protein